MTEIYERFSVYAVWVILIGSFFSINHVLAEKKELQNNLQEVTTEILTCHNSLSKCEDNCFGTTTFTVKECSCNNNLNNLNVTFEKINIS